jgi:hypothetical protein
LRINLDGKTSTDSSSDNDIFMIHINAKKATGHDVIFEYYDLDRTLNLTASGLPEIASVFNMYLSPKNNFLRNKQYIRSCFYKQDDEWIRFQTTEKLATLVTVSNGINIYENGNVEISSLGPRYFTPNIMEFEGKVPDVTLEILKVHPLACFEFENVDGETFIVFPLKSSVKPATKASQTYQGLSAPENILENLIDYEG